MSTQTSFIRVYECGCSNRPDAASGVMRNVSKCESHKRHAGRGGLAYYTELGCIVNGIPQHQKYGTELDEGLRAANASAMIQRCSGGVALEIGGGLGMYAPWLMHRGYVYYGCEPDAEAANWTRSTFDVPVENCTFEKYPADFAWVDLIVAAHVLEHIPDAPAALVKMNKLLPVGGRVIIIVPDDEDPVNPDHLWFFTPATLAGLLKASGFAESRMGVIRRVKQESFIYATAVKERE